MKIKKTPGLLIAIAWCLCLCFASCSDDDVEQLPPPDAEGYINLAEVKSLSLIQKTIRGTWKIHYAYGGITGRHKVVYADFWFRYLSNDSVYMGTESDPYTKNLSAITRKQTEFGRVAWVMSLASGEELIMDGVDGDTLVLGDNSIEPYGYHMTRQ